MQRDLLGNERIEAFNYKNEAILDQNNNNNNNNNTFLNYNPYADTS